ncbi:MULTISPECIES: YgcG family protein [Sphingomonas]|uniref:TPM domain-containing protein n=1 Tax=Sphingomonas TaxID=13687 RepID=UPI001AEE3989|nr:MULTISPECIES: TPM domain-containing protein [Sphingomonas]
MRRLIACLSAAWLACAATLLLGLAPGGAAAQTFPKFTGLVVDAANVLPPQTKADLTAKLEALQRDTKRQLVVATIPSLEGYPIEDYGYRLGRSWGVGLNDVNNGAILFIAPNESPGHRGPRIEVGRGLEPIVTDALSSVIINQDMMPRLKAGDIPGAMTAGTDALIQQLRANPDEAKARTDAAIKEFDATHRRASGGRGGGGVPIGLIFWGIILLFVVIPMIVGRRRQAGPWGRRYDGDGHGSGMLPIVLWSIANEIGRSASDRDDDDRGGWGGGGGGGGSDGSWGGGGFTGGGGGDFGGGGASGSW